MLPSWLRLRLRAKASVWSSAGKKLSLAAVPTKISALIGLDAPFILALLGVGLVLYATALCFFARQRPISSYVAWTAIAMDDGWVIGSIALLVFAPTLFSPFGIWLVAVVAAVVAGFAIAQFLGLRRNGWHLRTARARQRQSCAGVSGTRLFSNHTDASDSLSPPNLTDADQLRRWF